MVGYGLVPLCVVVACREFYRFVLSTVLWRGVGVYLSYVLNCFLCGVRLVGVEYGVGGCVRVFRVP